MPLFTIGILLYIPLMRLIEKKDDSYKTRKETDILPVIISIVGYQLFVMISNLPLKANIGYVLKIIVPYDINMCMSSLILGVSFSFLCCTAICDNRTTEIFDILYIPPTILCLGYGLFIRRGEMPRALFGYIGVVIFILFQFLVLSRFYGKSDVFAYSALAIVGTAVRATEWATLFCMMTSFGVFVAVQAANNNIGKKMKLKEEKALVPYIIGAYWPTLAVCKLISETIAQKL